MEPPPLLTAVVNSYGDLQTTRPSEFSPIGHIFNTQLALLISRHDATRGIWLRLPWTMVHLVPVAAAHTFTPHHWCVHSSSLILQWWSPHAGANPTPLHAHVDIGCGALVVNKRGELLAVRERYSFASSHAVWNPPGGHLDAGEDLLTCAAREAREEAGVAAIPLGIVGLHEFDYDAVSLPADATDATIAQLEHAARWGATHHGFWVLCYAADDRLSPDLNEVTEAKWLKRYEWTGAFSPPINAMLEAAHESGHLDAAAKAAAGGGTGAGTGTGTGTGINTGTGTAIGTPHPPFLLIAAAKTMLPGRRGPRSHTLYTALPHELVAKALLTAGAQGQVTRIGGGGCSGATPPPLKNAAAARSLAIFTFAVGLGFLLGARWVQQRK